MNSNVRARWALDRVNAWKNPVTGAAPGYLPTFPAVVINASGFTVRLFLFSRINSVWSRKYRVGTSINVTTLFRRGKILFMLENCTRRVYKVDGLIHWKNEEFINRQNREAVAVTISLYIINSSSKKSIINHNWKQCKELKPYYRLEM